MKSFQGVEQAREFRLDEALCTWLNSTDWYAQPDKEQLVFLSSAPTLAFFGQLLATRPHRLDALSSAIFRAAG
ncbi:hypothetical protein GTP46_18515 [Duganella sp. FT135W]|uniref:Uncharacterized protein n=1 Tax=Duganella flavida TaxID=2692175 RepID=A0A6L8KB01_9BURK|nr:hypothetical protein [Duganella flavida]MYM24633.1 hypothetical protein [Duganella flavida]